MKLFFKHQLGYFLFLLGTFVVPVGLYLRFSPYKAPFLPTTILVALFASQYVFHNEKSYRNKVEAGITEVLKGELKRVPSRKEIILRTTKAHQLRGVAIVVAAICLLTLMLIFNQF